MAGEPPPDGGGESDVTMGVSAVVIVLAVISVGLRFYTRFLTRAGLWWDDWLILAAVLFTLLTAALLLWGNGVNPHGQWVADNTNPDYVYTDKDVFYLKLSFISSVLYFTIAGTTKLGILLMYHRIFSASRSFRYQLIAASTLVIGFWIGCTVATLTNCIPLKWSWLNGLADPRYCFNYNIFWMASGACEIVLDVIILALPVRAVMNLQLSMKRKVTVAGIFFLGGFVVITGMVKTILGYPPGSRVPSYSKTEVWTTVHTGMSIVCATLPILRPLIRRITNLSIFSRISQLSSGRRHHYTSSRDDTPLVSVERKGNGGSSPNVVEESDSHHVSDSNKGGYVQVLADEQDPSLRQPADNMTPHAIARKRWTEYQLLNEPGIAEDIANTLSDGYGMDIETHRRRSQVNSFIYTPKLDRSQWS